jgi:hypothetical protein
VDRKELIWGESGTGFGPFGLELDSGKDGP